MSYPNPNVPQFQAPQQKKNSPWVWCGIAGVGCFVLIIPITAAILFPVFAQAREQARRSACASNEKQIALGLAMYMQDNNQFMPPSSIWATSASTYMKTNTNGGTGSLFHCPSADSTSYGYAMNNGASGVEFTGVPRPEQLVVIFESDSPDVNASGSKSDADLTRHSGGSNLAFLDGHTQWFESGKTDVANDVVWAYGNGN